MGLGQLGFERRVCSIALCVVSSSISFAGVLYFFLDDGLYI